MKNDFTLGNKNVREFGKHKYDGRTRSKTSNHHSVWIKSVEMALNPLLYCAHELKQMYVLWANPHNSQSLSWTLDVNVLFLVHVLQQTLTHIHPYHNM